MSDLTEMWTALERYQPYADKAGHGDSWRQMTTERTEAAADAAWYAAPLGVARTAVWAASWAAAISVKSWESGENWWIDRAITKINEAMQEVKP